jgi:hypothetical protein
VLTGSFNGWKSTTAECIPFEAVEGYDGWYVASYEPEAEPDAEKGLQAKPVMLDVDGNFNWEYQVGAATVIRGGVQVVQGGHAGEIDLINYGTDAPNVYTVDAWKQNPCNAVYHNYKFTVITDGCDGYVCPFIVGAFTNWEFQEMTYDLEASKAQNADVYVYYKKTAEETPFQVVSGLWNDQGQIEVMPDWDSGNAYLQKLVNGAWGRIPGESGDNLLTHEDANITIDVRDEDLRWARCVNEPAEYTVIRINLPADGCPEAVEIIGTFDAWEGTAMEHLDNGWWYADFEAKESQFFKIRSAGSWDYELELYNAEDDKWAKIGDGQLVFGQLWEEGSCKGTPCKEIEIDWSDPEVARWVAKEEGIENVVLTEKAKKVVVDGAVYIIRNNKMFNLQGAQVR